MSSQSTKTRKTHFDDASRPEALGISRKRAWGGRASRGDPARQRRCLGVALAPSSSEHKCRCFCPRRRQWLAGGSRRTTMASGSPACRRAPSRPARRRPALRAESGGLARTVEYRTATKSGLRDKSGTVRLATGQYFGLGCGPDFGEPEEMSNRAIWNVRLRHVWLATPLKGKRLKRRQRLRIGLEEALLRKAKNARQDPAATESES